MRPKLPRLGRVRRFGAGCGSCVEPQPPHPERVAARELRSLGWASVPQ